MIGAVRSTYRGYQLLIDPRDILAIAPNGDTHCTPSMQTIRSWVRKHERSAGGIHTSSPNSDVGTGTGAVPPAELN